MRDEVPTRSAERQPTVLLTSVQLRLIALEMHGIRGGLIEKGMLPELGEKLASWIAVVLKAEEELNGGLGADSPTLPAASDIRSGGLVV